MSKSIGLIIPLSNSSLIELFYYDPVNLTIHEYQMVHELAAQLH